MTAFWPSAGWLWQNRVRQHFDCPTATSSITPALDIHPQNKHEALPTTGALPVPSPKRVAEFAALCRDRFGVTFASEEEAKKAMTDVLQLYYVLGGHLRRARTLEGLAASEEKGENKEAPPTAET